MKTHTDEELQKAIDEAGAEVAKAEGIYSGLLYVNPEDPRWSDDSGARLKIAKAFLERLQHDPYAELKKAHAEGKVIEYNCGSVSEPAWEDLSNPTYDGEPNEYRIKPAPETFTAHGKTWTRHTPGDAMPCDGHERVEITTQRDIDENDLFNSTHLGSYWDWSLSTKIIGWRYADEPMPLNETPWTPSIGDIVQLKSGGPKMTIHFMDAENAGCVTFSSAGEFTFATLPKACLIPVTTDNSSKVKS